MNETRDFLAAAARLELEAANRFDQLARSMDGLGLGALQTFFHKMAEFSRLHLAEAMQLGGFHAVSEIEADGDDGSRTASPEGLTLGDIDSFTTSEQALELAISGERRAHAFYSGVAAETMNPEVRALALEFAKEEAEHAAELTAWRLNAQPAA